MAKKEQPSEYVTKEQAAEILGVTPRTVDRYADDKRITRYKAKIGRRVLFKRSELEEFKNEPPTPKE